MFNLERLETRLLLAGNVSATLKGHTLKIIGDNEGNALEFSGDGGTINVAGVDGTTVNGDAGATFDGVTKVIVKMNGGDDHIRVGTGIDGFDFDAAFKVDMGKGNDTFDINGDEANPHRFGGDLSIDMGSGNDQLYSEATTYGGKVKVNLGSGNDIYGTGADGTNVYAQAVKVKLGSGNDDYFSYGNEFQSTLKINGGSGSDGFITDNEFLPDNVFASAPKLKSIERNAGAMIT